MTKTLNFTVDAQGDPEELSVDFEKLKNQLDRKDKILIIMGQDVAPEAPLGASGRSWHQVPLPGSFWHFCLTPSLITPIPNL